MRIGMFLTGLFLLFATTIEPLRIQGQERTRLNQMVAVLEQGKAVFGTFVNSPSSPETAIQIAANGDLDFLIWDMEHNPWDVVAMRTFMQFLLDRGAIAKAGLSVNKPIIVRIGANGSEMNEWMSKQVLDQGVHGVLFPHIETPEEAFHAIRTVRYPVKPGLPDSGLNGVRGYSPGLAVRYWGMSSQAEYFKRAGIWRLDPEGEMIVMLLIESKRGVENVREIARQLKAKNVGAILFAGAGDMGMSYGIPMNEQKPGDAVDKGVLTVLAAGKEFDLPVAILGTADVKQRMEQGARVFVGGASAAARAAAGR